MYERIVSLAPSNTEILFALGAGDKLVAKTTQCDFPEKVKKLPSVSVHVKDMTFLDSLKPDLVLASGNVPILDKECRKRSITLHNVNPQSLQGIYDSIWSIAKLVEKENKADDVVYNTEKKLENIQSHAPQERKKIYCEEWHSPPTVSANWIPQMIECAGGTSLAQPDNPSYEIALKEVQDFDPDIIVLHWHGFGDASKPELVKKRKGWAALRAVTDGKVHCVHDTLLNRPGPRIWMGAQKLQELLKK